MVEVLVKLGEELDGSEILRGRVSRGFPVLAKPWPCMWSGQERLPKYAIIRISDSDDLTTWTEPIMVRSEYQILSHDIESDVFSVVITPSAQHESYKLPVTALAEFLQLWGAVNIVASDYRVDFDISGFHGMTSIGLLTFGSEYDFLKFTEESYDRPSGDHVISMDYSLSNLSMDKIKLVMREASMSIVQLSHDVGLCKFLGNRVSTIHILERQAEDTFHRMVARVKRKFDNEILNAAISAGGLVEISVQEAESHLVDVADII